MDRELLLQARDVSKSFGAVRVLHGVSFDVRRGEVLGILGPNGAGKTTLFNMISGDLKASGGEIRLGDRLLGAEPPFRRCQMGIGRTYQIPRPYSGMTTFENLLVASAFGGGKSEKDSYAFCAQVLADCELAPRANVQAGKLTLLDRKRLELARLQQLFPILEEKARTPVQSLSGGQQQMVSIGRALLCQPKVLLCDEISLGLAPKVIREIYAALPEIRGQGTAVIVVEQDVGLAKSASDRLYCMLEGRVTLTGRSSEVTREQIGAAYFGGSHAMV